VTVQQASAEAVSEGQQTLTSPILMGVSGVEVPMTEIRVHPLFEWERRRGRSSLGWLRTSHAQSILFGCVLATLQIILVLRGSLAHRALALVIGLCCPWLFFTGLRLRDGWRFLGFRETGLLRDLYLAGMDPLVTLAAFLRANRHGLDPWFTEPCPAKGLAI
jgi:hypothetical protein